MTLKTVTCTKYPDHRDFIPIPVLSENDLPAPYNTRDWVELITLLAHDTVRVSVPTTSPARTEQVGSTNNAGMRYGSGTAFLMEMGSLRRCSIPGCQENSGDDHLTSGVFKVVTAAHVVYDDFEAKDVVVEFFYDDESSATKSQIVRAQGLRTSSVDVLRNRCVLECVTHDTGLVSKLLAYRHSRNKLLSKLEQQLRKPALSPILESDDVREAQTSSQNQKRSDLAVVISHPHGCAKHVSVGSLINMARDGKVRNVSVGRNQAVMACLLEYTTATCPGSGGGSVSVFGEDQVFVAFAPHCATSGERHNVSGLGWTSRVNKV